MQDLIVWYERTCEKSCSNCYGTNKPIVMSDSVLFVVVVMRVFDKYNFAIVSMVSFLIIENLLETIFFSIPFFEPEELLLEN